MLDEKCVVLLTAKDVGPNGRDRLFLVQGTDDVHCMEKFRKFATDPENRWEISLDIRTIKYLGDGPESGSTRITNYSGITELDTTNNKGYNVAVNKDI